MGKKHRECKKENKKKKQGRKVNQKNKRANIEKLK